MKKILIIVPSLDMGGMERMLVNIANVWCSFGYEVTVYNQTHHCDDIISLFDKRINYFSQVEPKKWILHASLSDFFHGKVRILPHKLWMRFHSKNYLYKKYVKQYYDVEVAFFNGDPIKILSGSGSQKTKKIMWLHNEKLYLRNDDIKFVKLFDRIVCVSFTIAQKFITNYGFDKKVDVIYNINNISYIKFCTKELLETQKRKFTIISVGRLYNKQKGFERLLDVVTLLNHDSITFDLWIIGDGIDRKTIEKKIEQERLNNVKLFGYQKNPYKFINAADLFVCSSYYEGFSLVVAEAIILGVPVISTDCAGPNEILANGEFGMLCENSTISLYNGIKKIITDKTLYEHFKKKAVERQEFFSQNKIIRQLKELVEN